MRAPSRINGRHSVKQEGRYHFATWADNRAYHISLVAKTPVAAVFAAAAAFIYIQAAVQLCRVPIFAGLFFSSSPYRLSLI